MQNIDANSMKNEAIKNGNHMSTAPFSEGELNCIYDPKEKSHYSYFEMAQSFLFSRIPISTDEMVEIAIDVAKIASFFEELERKGFSIVRENRGDFVLATIEVDDSDLDAEEKKIDALIAEARSFAESSYCSIFATPIERRAKKARTMRPSHSKAN